MDLAVFYEATLTDCESGSALRAIVIPRSSLAPHVRDGLFDMTVLLGLEPLASLSGLEEIQHAVVSLLNRDGPGVNDLVSAAVNDAHLPFGAPLRALSLADLADDPVPGPNDASGAVLAAFHDFRLIVVSAADGLVLLGDVGSLAAAMAAGLEQKLRDLMGLDGREAQPLLHG